MPIEHFHTQYDLNVLGPLLTTQEALKLMGASGRSVVNVSSIVGQMPSPGFGFGVQRDKVRR